MLTLGELRKRMAVKRRDDPIGADAIGIWVDGIEATFADRVLAVDSATAREWGERSAQRSLPVIDTLIAATAIRHGLTLVTRNVRDVAGTGVRLLDPWRKRRGRCHARCCLSLSWVDVSLPVNLPTGVERFWAGAAPIDRGRETSALLRRFAFYAGALLFGFLPAASVAALATLSRLIFHSNLDGLPLRPAIHRNWSRLSQRSRPPCGKDRPCRLSQSAFSARWLLARP